MFQKEGSCTDIISSSNSDVGAGKGGGGKSKSKGKGKQHQQQSRAQQENPTTVSKAVNVPLRKSDRRKLRDRAAAYFSAGSTIIEEATISEEGSNTTSEQNDDAKDNNSSTLEALLDEIFLRGGTLSSRSLPRSISKTSNTNESKTKGNHENMVLYVKSPSTSEPESNSNSNSNFWPYQKKAQFVWMALEDKKSGKILHETPSVAMLAVVWHVLLLPDPEQAPSVSVSFRRDLERTRIVTVPSPVSRYLCRGADLMRAGIISAPENQPELEPEIWGLSKGNNNKKAQKKKSKSSLDDGGRNMVAICVKGNPQPFAVGRSVIWSNSSDDKPYGYDTKGVGVEIWNSFGDDLWRTTLAAGGGATKLGDSTDDGPHSLENGSYGNPGFCSIEPRGDLCVLPLVSDEEDEDEEEEEENSESEKEKEPTNEVASSSGDAASNKNIDTEETDTADDTGHAASEISGDEASMAQQPNTSEPANGSGIDGDGDDNKSEGNTETKALETEIPPSPDELLHAAVCQALINLRKNDLPMLVGTFYTKHVLLNKPKALEGTDLLKPTTYKKFGSYLKQWQINDRDDSGLFQTGPDPSNSNNMDPNAILISFNRRHEDLHGMRKTKPSEGSGNAADGNSKIALVKLYVVPQNWTVLLRLDPEDINASNASSETRRGTGMLTLPEVKKLLDGYLQRESSLMISKSTVALDGPLTDALYGKKTKEAAPEQLSRKDISKRFVDRMSPAYCLVQMPGSHVLKLGRGIPPKVQIEVVKRQSKKFVTRLRGLEEYLGNSFAVDPTEFAKSVSKRLAMSASVDSDPAASGRAALPKKGCVEYIFGANIVDELEALLTGDESLSDHGGAKGGWAYPRIPGAVIEVTLRKGVPARRKRGGGR